MREASLRTGFGTSAGLPDCSPPVSWLTPFEHERLARLRVPKRRGDWILGRFTAKRLLSESAQEVLGDTLSPDAFEIASEDSGAPFVRLVSGERLPVCITISHARGTAFCALIAARPGGGSIGGDLEWIEPRSPGFVRDFFTPAEVDAWEESSLAERPLVANAIWSAKESVLKALGLGLSVDTRSVEIHLSLEPADEALRPRDAGWRRFGVACEARVDDDENPLSGFWKLQGPFVLTMASRSTNPGKDLHVSH